MYIRARGQEGDTLSDTEGSVFRTKEKRLFAILSAAPAALSLVLMLFFGAGLLGYAAGVLLIYAAPIYLAVLGCYFTSTKDVGFKFSAGVLIVNVILVNVIVSSSVGFPVSLESGTILYTLFTSGVGLLIMLLICVKKKDDGQRFGDEDKLPEGCTESRPDNSEEESGTGGMEAAGTDTEVSSRPGAPEARDGDAENGLSGSDAETRRESADDTGKKRPHGCIVALGIFFGVVLILLILLSIEYPSSPADTMRRLKRDIPAAHQFIRDNQDNIRVFLSIRERLTDDKYEQYYAYLDTTGEEMALWYTDDRNITRDLRQSSFEDGGEESRISEAQFDAMYDILRRLKNYGWRSVHISRDTVRIDFKSIAGGEIYLTTKPLQRDSLYEYGDSLYQYYSEPADFGLYIQICSWSAMHGVG